MTITKKKTTAGGLGIILSPDFSSFEPPKHQVFHGMLAVLPDSTIPVFLVNQSITSKDNRLSEYLLFHSLGGFFSINLSSQDIHSPQRSLFVPWFSFGDTHSHQRFGCELPISFPFGDVYSRTVSKEIEVTLLKKVVPSTVDSFTHESVDTHSPESPLQYHYFQDNNSPQRFISVSSNEILFSSFGDIHIQSQQNRENTINILVSPSSCSGVHNLGYSVDIHNLRVGCVYNHLLYFSVNPKIKY